MFSTGRVSQRILPVIFKYIRVIKMKITRFMALALSLLMLCAVLAGCSGDKSDGQNAGGGAASGAAPMEVVAHVQSAIDASDLLTASNVAIIPGEGIVSCGSNADNYLPAYSMLDLKKIVISKSASTAIALTNNGQLYFKTMKVADNVTDMVYATTNMNEEGWYTTANGDVYCMYKGFDSGEFNSYCVQEGTSPITAIGVEKHDVFIACENGFVSTSGDSEHWGKCAEFMNWGGGIAVIDASKVMNPSGNGEVDYATVAAITADGRTLAVGDFADEILGWGELSYISMNDGVIVGLKPDGTLRVTGPYAQLLLDGGLGSLTNIAGVKVLGEIVSAVDTSGNYYFLQYDVLSDYCYSMNSVSLAGASNENTYATIYTGSFEYHSEYSSPAWTDDDGNARPAGSTVALRGESTLEYPLTAESVTAYLDNMFADRKAELDAQQYYWEVSVTDNGAISQLFIRTRLWPDEVDNAFLLSIVRDVISSELIWLTPASLKEFDAAEMELNDSLTLDGWELYYVNCPDGSVLFSITSR